MFNLEQYYLIKVGTETNYVARGLVLSDSVLSFRDAVWTEGDYSVLYENGWDAAFYAEDIGWVAFPLSRVSEIREWVHGATP